MSQVLPILFEKKPCYDIVISADGNDFGEMIAPFIDETRKVCIITDTKVQGLHADFVKEVLSKMCKEVFVFAIPAGEENKNLDEIRKTYAFLVENKFNRNDLLIALGGGVVGDMTGYIAATYLRGVDFIQMPTTLLAQNDSSIGGKTGVDFDGYKNMVGAFKMPKLVYMNLSFLNTLDDRQYFSGFAEVMKHGIIKDAKFYTWLIENMYEICDKDLPVLEEMVLRSCTIKKAVVEKDPYEKGDRALLNFGHTIGHAIEKYKEFAMTHGECIALGCVAAAYISWKREMISMETYYEIRDMFVPFNLPITVTDIDKEVVYELMQSDKKATANGIRFVLISRLGRAVIATDVTKEEIFAALDEIIFDEEENL